MESKFNIKKFNPCNEGLRWYNTQPNFKTAWENCHRGDWMLWIASKLNVCPLAISLAKGYCAKTVYHLMTDERSKDAVVAAINYGRGLISKKELQDSAIAAYVAYVAYVAYDTYVAYTAADAAADADAVAAYTAAAADVVIAKIKNQKKTADICRKYLTPHMEKYF